ncbi:MAG: hypothetical protein JWN52_7760 [Actinomycetia bacterium]|nr:hypothetical protein [Actinomycetes bacterium]
MTSTATAGLARLRELADRADLADLLSRQGLWLDEQRFDDAASIFTEDAVVHTQGGRSQGLKALTAQARRVHADFAATQSVTSGVLHAAALVLGPGACPLEMLEIRIGRTELTLKHPGRRGAQRPGCGLRPHMTL